jgi:hypothetical protein
LPTLALGGQGAPVTAKLDGQTNISITLNVEASEELQRLIEITHQLSTQAYGDVRADTGVSMPGSLLGQTREESVICLRCLTLAALIFLAVCGWLLSFWR